MPPVWNENISKSILRRYLPANAVIIDCGAHDGADTVALANLFRKGTLHSFEPVPGLFKRLCNRPHKYDNIRYYPIALADTKGTMDMFVSEGGSDGSSSLLEPKLHLADHPDTYFEKRISVETESLDSWAQRYNISKVDMLWLDMQGYELNMLKESKEILGRVSVIHTEVSTRETYKGVAQYDAYRIFLEEQGFKVVIEAIPKGWDMGNVLFVRQKF